MVILFRVGLFLQIYLGLLLTIIVVDFDFEESKDGSFIKRGGPQLPTSPEREAQEHRESTTLMVFYTSPADMPDTPKEPPTPDPDEIVTEVLPFGELPDMVKVCYTSKNSIIQY